MGIFFPSARATPTANATISNKTNIVAMNSLTFVIFMMA